MKIGSSVLIGKAKVHGVIQEIAKDSVLVDLEIKIDGVLKGVKQWYSLDMVTEVDLHKEAEDVFKGLESKGLSSKEISVLDSAGGDKFKKTAIAFGILDKEEI